jgi:membrane protein YdbS with pleckstrin-like domain
LSRGAQAAIERSVVDDPERPVFETRLHPVSLAGTMVYAACVVGATALIVVRNPLSSATVAQLWMAAAAVIGLGSAAPLARWWSSRFSVSTDRLTIRTGGFRSQRIEIPLARLADISVMPGVLGRLLGYGTVRIVPAGEPAEVFPRVAAPEALRDAILRQPRTPRRRPPA